MISFDLGVWGAAKREKRKKRGILAKILKYSGKDCLEKLKNRQHVLAILLLLQIIG